MITPIMPAAGADTVEETANLEHLSTRSLPGLHIDVFADAVGQSADTDTLLNALDQAWKHYRAVAAAEGVLAVLGLEPEKHPLELELNLVGDATMRAVNRAYRGKDRPTDVLSFTLLADAPDRAVWLALPEVPLGSLFLSVEWARAYADPGGEVAYLTERFVHGLLHLMGMHHDTMPAFERVVAIQQTVLQRTFGAVSP